MTATNGHRTIRQREYDARVAACTGWLRLVILAGGTVAAAVAGGWLAGVAYFALAFVLIGRE